MDKSVLARLFEEGGKIVGDLTHLALIRHYRSSSTQPVVEEQQKPAESPARASESHKEGHLPAIVPQTSHEETPIATACVACAVGHFSTSSGMLKEALRFKGEGITSHEILDRIACSLEEQNSLEREDLTPDKMLRLPAWEKPIAEDALIQSRALRHRLETIETIEELEQIAAAAREYYLKLTREWFRGRFIHLGTKKAEAIAKRAGGA